MVQPQGDSEQSRAIDDLARRAQVGDRGALAELLERVDADGSIRVPVRKVLMNRTDVEDVSHDVLILIAERLHTWDGHRRFTTWLRVVARNAAIDHLRRTRPHTTQPLPDQPPTGQQRISDQIATRESLRSLLAALPDRYRIPVELRDLEGLDYHEISRTLGMPPSTARTRVARGRALLAAGWANLR